MDNQIRRVVTGHDAAGHAVVVSDGMLESTPDPDGLVAADARLDHPSAPADNEDPADGRDRSVALTLPGGSVLRVVDLLPGMSAPLHRTSSLDYGIVLSGAIELVLDNDAVTLLAAGDIIIQRGTIHGWRNPSDDTTARVVFTLLDAAPVTVDGIALPDIHPGCPGVSENRTSVAIVGGGPVGTALAIELGMRGIDCTLIERHREPQPVPKGQNLTQRTLEHFRAWGIESQLRAARTMSRDQGAAGMTSYGTLLGEYRYPWMQRERVAEFYAAANERLPQYATERVLRARVAELPSVTTKYEWTAETLTVLTDSVALELASKTGQRQVLAADWVVACDGARSRIRSQAQITQSRADHDRLMVLVVFRSAEFDRLMERFPGVTFANVLHPDFEGYWQFFGRVDSSETWFFHAPVDPGSTEESLDLRAILAKAVGVEFAFTVEYLGFWDLRFTLADSYRSGRVLVAGDAAHSHPPYGGYGINTGFEDAVNLGWKLAAELQGWAGPGLLDSYDAERRPVFASTRDDFIERSIRDDRDFVAAHDPLVDRAAFEASWHERESGARAEVGAFEPNYEGSPLVPGTGRPTALGNHEVRARAGHHLAPGVAATGGTVFDALGSGFTLLLDDLAAGEDVMTAAHRLGVPLDVVGITPASVQTYGAAAVLVRPDQFVAWAGDPRDASAVDALLRSTGRA